MENEAKDFIVTAKWFKKECLVSEDEVMEFKKHFPNGGTAIDVLNKYMSLADLRLFGWILTMLPSSSFAKGTDTSYLINELIQYKSYDVVMQLLAKLPFNETPLVVDNVNSCLFHDGDVYAKGDVNPLIFDVKGHLKIDGNLTVKDIYTREFSAQKITANEINLLNHTKFYATCVKAKAVNLGIYSMISGDVEADTVKLNQSLVLNNITANEIINDNGHIWGHVNTKKIKNINGNIGGNVDADEIINDGGVIKGNVYTFNIININGGRVDGEIFYKDEVE